MKTYIDWTEQIRDGLKPLQERSVPRYKATELFRFYSSTLVPGLLQTEEYATAVLRVAARFHDLPVSESSEAARARLNRSSVIREPGHRFDFVIEESVLRCQIADPHVLSAQLRHLLPLDAVPAVSLGIIPTSAHERLQWPQETFHMFDEALVTVELVSGEVAISKASDIALYVKVFEELRSMAVYGAKAYELIMGAIESLH
ncbi:DUF5753 domain-containing protein [Streptomyces sp. NPDC002547]